MMNEQEIKTVVNGLKEAVDKLNDVKNLLDGLGYYITDEQPTIKPQLRWIPCSERLPEDSDCYIVTYNAQKGNDRWTACNWYSANHGGWDRGCNPVAWMPLPEPYKESRGSTE